MSAWTPAREHPPPVVRNDRWHRLRSCVGKRRYRTYEHAKSAAAHLSRKHGEDLHGYECAYCGGHHLGHRMRRP